MVPEKCRWGLLPSGGCGCLLHAYLYRFGILCQISSRKKNSFCNVIVWNVVFDVFLAVSSNLGLFFLILPCSQKASEWSSDDESRELHTAAPGPTQTNHVQTEGSAPCHSYRKSLRLSSDQIVRWLVTFTGCITDTCEVKETFKNTFKQQSTNLVDTDFFHIQQGGILGLRSFSVSRRPAWSSETDPMTSPSA